MTSELNARAVPDVPELKRYGQVYNNGLSWSISERPDVEYVRHDQAAAVIAAKDAALDGLSVVVDECNAEIEGLSVENVALKNKLAQIEQHKDYRGL